MFGTIETRLPAVVTSRLLLEIKVWFSHVSSSPPPCLHVHILIPALLTSCSDVLFLSTHGLKLTVQTLITFCNPKPSSVRHLQSEWSTHKSVHPSCSSRLFLRKMRSIEAVIEMADTRIFPKVLIACRTKLSGWHHVTAGAWGSREVRRESVHKVAPLAQDEVGKRLVVDVARWPGISQLPQARCPSVGCVGCCPPSPLHV